MSLKINIFIAFTILFFTVNTQTPPNWGNSPRYTVDVYMVYDSPAVNWTFTYFYDWNQKVQRYEHGKGQYDEVCMLPNNTSFEKGGIPCNVIFATDGWFYITFPSQNFCCKCGNSFGSVRYDWLKADSKYIGIETVNGTSVTHWTKQGQSLNHYYSTVDKQIPVRYYELKNGKPKYWLFNVPSYNTGPIDPAKFAAPCSTRCSGQCSKLVQEEYNLETN